MPLVTVVVRSASGGATPSLTFEGERTVIGRSDGCDMRLPDPSVSHRHASIRAQGGSFALVDEGSSNGTWVGSVKLTPHTPRLLKSGDRVRLGRVWLEIIIGQELPTPDLGLATRDLALALVRNAMAAVGDDALAKVRVTEGPDIGAELPLAVDDRSYVIGRAESCDLPLADEDASREHLTITRRGAQFFVRDLGSMNGVYLGATRITPDRDVIWRPPTMARVGMSVLALDEPVSAALAELEAAADEIVPDEAAPPEPPPSVAAPSAKSDANADIPATGAPIAAVAAPAPVLTTRKAKRAWTPADIAVVTVAVAVIGASIAGLVWVLK